MRIGGTDIVGGGTDNAADFVIPRDLFPTQEKRSSFARADLILYEDKSHWYLPWHWIWPDIVQLKYNLLFTVLPKELGTYTVHTMVKTEQDEEQPYVSRVLVADHTNTPAHDCFFPPRSGGGSNWLFDLSTVRPIADQKRGYYKGQRDDRYNHGGVGWWEGVLTPQQICLRVDANVGAKEDGAHTEGHFETKMFRSVESESKKSPPPCLDKVGQEIPLEKKDPSKGCPLYWNLPIPIPVMDKVIRQYISISLFDEMAYIKGVGESASLPFLKVESNTRNKLFILTPDVNWVVH